MVSVTFIIPTIGRETLGLSISALINQNNPNWKAIIVFDGIAPTISCKDPRITILTCEKLGERHNSAGKVRNYAIPFVETEWIAFLDDDDTVAEDYVKSLFDQLEETPELEVLIFRMKHRDIGIIPSLEETKIVHGNVGISFSLKTKIMKEDNNIFIPSHCEDFVLLNTLFEKKYKMMFFPYVKYFVRSLPKNITDSGTNTKFNF